MTLAADDTKDRLLAAAANLFAERGFNGATMRELAMRGGVNLAASHYHCGSKRDLYLEVLRAQFARIRGELAKQGAEVGLSARPTKKRLTELLHIRIRVMLDLLLGPPPSLHGALMQREMIDPSAALPVIVDEFMNPMFAELQEILRGLAPALTPAAIESCSYSIVGQILFYRLSMPALLHMKKRESYPVHFAATAADHILAFSLGGLERVSGKERVRRAPAK